MIIANKTKQTEQKELFENPNKLIYYITNTKGKESIYKYKWLYDGVLTQKEDSKPLNKFVTIHITEDITDKEGNIKKKKTGETITYNTIPLLESSLEEIEKEVYKQQLQNINKPLELDEEYNTEKEYLEIYNNKINLFNKQDYLKYFNKGGEIIPTKGEYPLIKHLLLNMFGECYEDKLNFLRFKYQNPFINTGFAFVLYGANQIGKSTFIDKLLLNIFGLQNTSPNENINKGEDLKFNSGWVDKMITCFEEYKASDSVSIDTLKILIKANKYNKEGKGINKELIPHYNTYYINTNDYPVFLEEQKNSKRFIVLDLAKFNSDSNPLYKIDSTESDFINEIPYFIYDLMNSECVRPQYKDFDAINTLNNYTNNNNNIWINIFRDLIKNSNIDYIPHSTGYYIPLLKSNSNIELINQELNSELGNSLIKSVNYNKQQLITKIIDLKSDLFKTCLNGNGNKKKKVNGRVLNDYILIDNSVFNDDGGEDKIEDIIKECENDAIFKKIEKALYSLIKKEVNIFPNEEALNFAIGILQKLHNTKSLPNNKEIELIDSINNIIDSVSKVYKK